MTVSVTYSAAECIEWRKECDDMLISIGKNPAASAQMKGSEAYSGIRGRVDLYDTYGGTVLVAELYGIPRELEKSGGFYGFHIHEGSSCTGNEEDAFADTGMHYNPKNTPHPQRAGDLPPLMSNDGVIWTAVYTSRFYPEDVIGRTIVLHEKVDDFRTQPSGDSGRKIACGEIISTETA